MIRVRFELTTHGLEDRCSIQLSYQTDLSAAKLIIFFELWKFYLLLLNFCGRILSM